MPHYYLYFYCFGRNHTNTSFGGGPECESARARACYSCFMIRYAYAYRYISKQILGAPEGESARARARHYYYYDYVCIRIQMYIQTIPRSIWNVVTNPCTSQFVMRACFQILYSDSSGPGRCHIITCIFMASYESQQILVFYWPRQGSGTSLLLS